MARLASTRFAASLAAATRPRIAATVCEGGLAWHSTYVTRRHGRRARRCARKGSTTRIHAQPGLTWYGVSDNYVTVRQDNCDAPKLPEPF